MSTRSDAAEVFRRQAWALVDFERYIDELKPYAAAHVRLAYANARRDGETILAAIEIAKKRIAPEDRR